jgi:hypothetical protein
MYGAMVPPINTTHLMRDSHGNMVPFWSAAKSAVTVRTSGRLPPVHPVEVERLARIRCALEKERARAT